MIREFSEQELEQIKALEITKEGVKPEKIEEILDKDTEDYIVVEKIKHKTKSSWAYNYIVQCKHCKIFKKIAPWSLNNMHPCMSCESKKWREDFIGFENVTYKVLEFDHADKRRKLYYLCECKNCGSQHVVRKDNIIESTCGKCFKCVGNSKTAGTDTVIRRHMDRYVSGAKSRNLIFELTFDEFKDITSKDCHYCGSKPTALKGANRYNKTGTPVLLNGVDRIDSDKGYTLDNVVPCCGTCNLIKMDLKYDDFLNHIDKIHNHIKCASTIPEGSTDKCSEMEDPLITEK
jgi:hypothetical protein